MASTVFFDLFTRIDTTLKDLITAPLAKMIESVSQLAVPVLTIWIIVKAINMFKGNEPLTAFIYDVVIATIVLSISINLTNLNNFIIDNATKIGDWIAGIAATDDFDGSEEGAIGKLLDKLANSFFDSINAIWNDLHGWDILAGIPLAILAGAFIMLMAQVVFNIGQGKVGTIILLILSPLFIFFLIFKSTKEFFTQWLGFLLNFQMYIALSVLVLVFFTEMTVFNDFNKITVKDLTGIMLPLVMMIICIKLMHQVPLMATAIVGGIALSTANAISSMSNFVSGGAKVAGKAAGKAAKAANTLTGNKVGKALTNAKDKTNSALEKRGIPSFRSASEKKAAFQQNREQERQRRIDTYAGGGSLKQNAAEPSSKTPDKLGEQGKPEKSNEQGNGQIQLDKKGGDVKGETTSDSGSANHAANKLSNEGGEKAESDSKASNVNVGQLNADQLNAKSINADNSGNKQSIDHKQAQPSVIDKGGDGKTVEKTKEVQQKVDVTGVEAKATEHHTNTTDNRKQNENKVEQSKLKDKLSSQETKSGINELADKAEKTAEKNVDKLNATSAGDLKKKTAQQKQKFKELRSESRKNSAIEFLDKKNKK